MKKVNCAEEIEPQSVSMPGQRMAPNKQFPLFVSLLSRQSDIRFHDCIVFVLMATLSTSQMNARWNGESSSIMWPTALRGWLQCSQRQSQRLVWKRRWNKCTYRSYLKYWDQCSMSASLPFEFSSRHCRPTCCLFVTSCFKYIILVMHLLLLPQSCAGGFCMWWFISDKNTVRPLKINTCFAPFPWTPWPPQMWVWTFFFGSHKACFLHCGPYAH